MKIFRNAFMIFILISLATTAMAAPASEKSVKQLLAVTQVPKFVDNMIVQINSNVNKFIQQELKGRNPNAKQQKAIFNTNAKMTALLKKELAWKKLEPMYVRLYKESFTEEEVAGMLAFYKTPAGKAVINKVPVIMQKTMLESQKIISAAMPQINKIQNDFDAEMKAAGK